MWTTIDDAITSLRKLLSDGPTDKLCSEKAVFGNVDGVNVRFKTFERRLNTDFTVAPVAPSPEGIYVDDVLVLNTAVASHDLVSGTVTLSTAPADGSKVRATYYYRWFNDDELTEFLTNAVQWLGFGTDVTTVPDGLVPAVMHYAGQEAYSKLSLWWSTKISTTYLLEDAPDEQTREAAKRYAELAQFFNTKSITLRDDFYKRQGQSLAPRFRVLAGAVRDVVPRR